MFITPLQCEDLVSGKRKLLVDLIFQKGSVKSIVKAGFETDGTSVPFFLRWWVSPWKAPYQKPAVLHDEAYFRGLLTRRNADWLFFEAMLSEARPYIIAKTPIGSWITPFYKRFRLFYCWFTAMFLFTGVRLFGWFAWHGHRKRESSL